jgi:hypothetical protein
MSWLARPAVGALFLLLCGFFSGDAGALSPAQCSYFEVGGKTAICHATRSAENPFVLINIPLEACIASHAGHPQDFVALGGSCEQPTTLPLGAPCDATLACSEGLACTAGICTLVQ